MFSAAGGAVIALGDKQARCNNIINLLTTTEERAPFLQSLCRFTVVLLCCLSAGLLQIRCVCQNPSDLGSFCVPKAELVLSEVIKIKAQVLLFTWRTLEGSIHTRKLPRITQTSQHRRDNNNANAPLLDTVQSIYFIPTINI